MQALLKTSLLQKKAKHLQNALEGRWKPWKHDKPIEEQLAEAIDQRAAILETLKDSEIIKIRPDTNNIYQELIATKCLVASGAEWPQYRILATFCQEQDAFQIMPDIGHWWKHLQKNLINLTVTGSRKHHFHCTISSMGIMGPLTWNCS